MNQEYKRLKDKWYKKLKASGFEDIEDTESPREMLKSWHSTWFFTHSDPLHFKSKHRYFHMCEQFLNFYAFDSHEEKEIWVLHSEGFSVREIAKEVGVCKTKVNEIVVWLQKIMRRGF